MRKLQHLDVDEEMCCKRMVLLEGPLAGSLMWRSAGMVCERVKLGEFRLHGGCFPKLGTLRCAWFA